MKHQIALAASLLPFAAVAMGPAQAQVVYMTPRVYVAPPLFAPSVPPDEVVTIVRASGYTPLTRPARRGGRYLILASDRTGGQVRIVLSAHTGNIVRVEPAYDPRFAYQPVRPPAPIPGAPPRARVTELPPPDVKDPPQPRAAPRDAAPDVTGSLPPRQAARTPLPRPRPSTASSNPTLAGAATSGQAVPPPAKSEPAAPAAPAAAPAAAPQPSQEQAAPPPPTETKLVPVAPLD